MDVDEAIVQAWVLAGEPSDLDPILAGATETTAANLDTASLGVAHYLREFSYAQTVLANWRTSKGRPIRFQKFMTQKNVQLGLSEANRSYDVVYVDANILRIDDPPSWLTEEILESAKCEVTITGTLEGVATTEEIDNIVMVAEFTDAGNLELYLRDDLDEVDFTITGYSVELFLDRFQINRDTNVATGVYVRLPVLARNVLKVTEAENGGNLKVVHMKDDLYNAFLSAGTPSEYYILGEKMFFDVYLEDPAWFTIEYQRLPAPLTGSNDSFDIPDEWHIVLLTIVEWREAIRMQDSEKQMLKKAQINQLINQLRTDMEEEWLRNENGGFYVQKESR